MEGGGEARTIPAARALEVVNDFRAGGQEPVIARDNARQYITWLNDITLNGGSGRSAGLPTRDSSSMKSGRL